MRHSYISSAYGSADTEGQKIALFQYIAKNYKSLGITWSRVADALSDIEYRDLAVAIREKYCCQTIIDPQK